MYRETDERDQLSCPRCQKPLPPLDVAACTCGTWVSAFAASVVLSREELAADPITRWWRIRAPCPMCGVQMLLHGVDPWFLQGCERHGYWIDADTIEHTGLGSADLQEVESRCNDPARAEAERARLEKLELAAAAERERHELVTARAQERAAEELTQAERAARELREELAREARIEAEAIKRTAVEEHRIRLQGAIGATATQWLIGRLTEVEHRNAALEKRVAELERRLAALATSRTVGEP